MLTPLDIHNREFRRSLRGYDIDEVDEFLDEVIRDFETLYKENLDLKEKIQKQDDNINKYKELEETLQNTLVLVQQLSEEVKQNAEQEAKLIIWEAQKKAEQINDGIQVQIMESTRKLEAMRGLEKQLYVKLKTFLATQLDLMKNYDLEKTDQEMQKTYEANIPKEEELAKRAGMDSGTDQKGNTIQNQGAAQSE